MNLYKWLIVEPLRRLYLHGPGSTHFGFWAGQETTDICSDLTSASAGFWLQNMEDCQKLIDDRFESFLILLEVCGYFWILYCSMNVLVCQISNMAQIKTPTPTTIMIVDRNNTLLPYNKT